MGWRIQRGEWECDKSLFWFYVWPRKVRRSKSWGPDGGLHRCHTFPWNLFGFGHCFRVLKPGLCGTGCAPALHSYTSTEQWHGSPWSPPTKPTAAQLSGRSTPELCETRWGRQSKRLRTREPPKRPFSNLRKSFYNSHRLNSDRTSTPLWLTAHSFYFASLDKTKPTSAQPSSQRCYLL